MRAIIVDDEPLILNIFENMLLEFDDVEVVGKYTDPFKAIDEAILEEVDIAFLDIEMPNLNGMDVAAILKRFIPDVNIVFVTAHSDYAVRSFELDAIDYLTRPVHMHRLEETFNKINARSVVHESVSSDMIHCFGSLSFQRANSQKKINPSWRTKRAQEIFAYLLFNHDQVVRKDVLVELFWPNTNWEQGISQLYNMIYQIRKTIEEIDFNIDIESKENYYMLRLNDVKVDIHEWEKAIDSLDEINERTIYRHLASIKLYTGDFLQIHNYTWALKEQKRLRTTWIYHVRKVLNYLIDTKEFVQAINLGHYIQKICPTNEKFYFKLMKLYAATNNESTVKSQYETLKKSLQTELDSYPSEEVRIWYENWQKQSRT